ncbi:MAG TPA: SMP-30/gluconolactonase/LRE family protein [Sedimentisphaerales bacterium]|nr:SMP-30/gluconolactonase/LRE family protein [Sedimentisphaerales bacterium]
MRRYATLTVVLAVSVFASCAHQRQVQSPLAPAAVLEGFDVPECALVDPQTGFIYVSNIEATPETYWSDNGKGSISRLRPDGTIDALRWIDSSPEFVLNSPKGMCILNGRLYVADNTRILVFSLDSGRPVIALAVEGAERLNDMATDGRQVYVSDTQGGRILRVDGSGQGGHETVAELESVNGITFDGERMYAVSWDLHDVYQIDRSGRQPPQPFGLAEHFAHLDGIEVLDDGSFIVSDFVGNKVVRISKDRRTVTTLAELKTPADIGLDRANRRLFVPQLTVDKLAIYPLP